MISYEILILGNVKDEQVAVLSATLREIISDFGLSIGSDVEIRTRDAVENRDRHVAAAAIYFGGPNNPDEDIARTLSFHSIPIIPVVDSNSDFGVSVPHFLHQFNGYRMRDDDPAMIEISTALLECIGLVRPLRRVFISYKRTESRVAAAQLHDLISARGYDVFLDTHDIRPGEPFQDILWHRLCDSDLLIMLDTPLYFESKWTRQEIGRARAKEIHVLRLVWPEHKPNRMTEFAETLYLESQDFGSADGSINAQRCDEIILAVERLRSKSIASRYISITGKLRAEIAKIGATIESVGANRTVAIKLEDGRRIWAYPIVGIPSAEILNEISVRARMAYASGTPVLIYDHVGIRDRWNEHLAWLDENIRSVRSIKVSEAAWQLVELGEG
ncbi:toll/interleukin-1 receptor domain-containing protein [Jiella pacifica]|uniref:TIR domain-containing protein n=1 Tax=Jiella pacifica TaxID=2696469 RepID=A0A6N9T854_9HYPH|nr:toll/interleukin-1 receptor domain-containing protein [Jiella pacifica]NDW05108.1 TIR domain-containing protein [Jiella pacifica]